MNISIPLPERFTPFLASQPESGMGYHRVDLVLESGSTLRHVIVLNAETLVLPEECAGVPIRDLRLHDPLAI